MSSTSPMAAADCTAEDGQLAAWTFLRYCAVGSILIWRVNRIRKCAKSRVSKSRFCRDHPGLTKEIQRWPFGIDFVFAGGLFVQTEGIGLTVFFIVSGLMDFWAIFLISHVKFCKTVLAVSLYSMGLISFLPNVCIGEPLQRRWYDGKDIMSKALFVVIMVCISVFFFMVRMLVVYQGGYAEWMHGLFEEWQLKYRVLLGVAVPPLVDAIQSIVLIKVGLKDTEKVKDDALDQSLLPREI